MLIDIGYDIELALSAPTALIYLLRVHPNREHDLQGSEGFQVQPALDAREYFDSFGNRCGRIQIPANVSTVRLTDRARIYDSGRPDPVNYGAYQYAPQDLPEEVRYPMDFSAWFEVYLGGQWYTFDARHNTPRIGRVAMAMGRDAGDVPITMTFGPNSLTRFEVTTDEVTQA